MKLTEEHRSYLAPRMEPDFGLLDKLLSKQILDQYHIDEIKCEKTVQRRNEKMLEFIRIEKKDEQLLLVLEEAKQKHLVNYVTSNGDHRSEFGGVWPLTDGEVLILDANRESLVDIIDPQDLIVRLFSWGIINQRQREFIGSKQTSYEKNGALLDILRRRSIGDYHAFIKCLHLSNQSHVAQLLKEGGVVVRTDVRIMKESRIHVDEVEVAAKIADLIRDRQEDGQQRILELAQLNLIASRKGDSIVFYFYCRTLEDLLLLDIFHKRGRLKRSFESLYKRMISCSRKIRVTIVSPAKEFRKSRRYFNESVSKDRIVFQRWKPEFSATSMSDLPLELLDVILQKSFLSQANKMTHGRPKRLPQCPSLKDSFNRLASVDCCWFQRTKRRKFVRAIWRRMRVYCIDDSGYAIIRINQPYLFESIQVKGIINQLRSDDSLTDLEARRIRGYKRDRDKHQDVVRIVRSSTDGRRYEAFVHCLRRTNQKPMATVLQNGGVVVKAQLRIMKMTSTETLQTIVELLNKINEVAEEAKEFIQKMKDKDMEIIGSYADGGRHLVVWIWCRSEEALEKLQTMKDSKLLQESFVDLIKWTRREGLKSMNISIHNDQLKILYVICRKNEISFTKRLDSEGIVHGVTKLRSAIHVLCQFDYLSPSDYNSIHVFDDRNPFRLLRKIKIREIKEPVDIGSSETENCLYVTDRYLKSEGGRIWKISGETDHQVTKWLNVVGRVKTLSVSSDGQLLMVRKSDSSPADLLIYGPDAVLRLSLQLPEDIQRPEHAVETSTGNFVILHIWTDMNGSSGRGRGWIGWVVSELSRDGQTVVRRFIPKDETQELTYPSYLSLDSVDDRVFVAGRLNRSVIELDSDLNWKRILIDYRMKTQEEKIEEIDRLCYDEEKKQLIVGGKFEVNVHTLNWKQSTQFVRL